MIYFPALAANRHEDDPDGTDVGRPKPKGKGSLENPEVYENVPGHVIPILEREFDDFDTEADALPRRRADRGASSSASG